MELLIPYVKLTDHLMAGPGFESLMAYFFMSRIEESGVSMNLTIGHLYLSR